MITPCESGGWRLRIERDGRVYLGWYATRAQARAVVRGML